MTTPAYYQFPGGLQPLHLSRHLTSNAGQAVQYLARSSRLDGVSKGQDESDLNKALDFIRDEIDRRFGALPVRGVPRTEDMEAAARVILASVDDPEPTLAEEVKKGLLFRVTDTDAEGIKDALDLAARVEQIENELYEYRMLAKDEADLYAEVREERDAARTEVDRLTAERDDLDNGLAAVIEQRNAEETAKREAIQQRDAARTEVDRLTAERESREMALHEHGRLLAEARAEVERLTAERVTDPSPTLNDGSMMRPATVAREENVAPDQQGDPLPNPADVPEGQAWIVEYHGDDLPALRRLDHPGDWYLVRKNGTGGHVRSQDITLVSRLVPAPRQATTLEDLYRLPEDTVVRNIDGEVGVKGTEGRWYLPSVTGPYTAGVFTLPVTVLWEPEVTA